MVNISFYARYLYYTFISSPGPFFTEKDFPDLSGQTWLVTGATGGIGLAVAKILVAQNATVWIMGRNQEKLDTALDVLRQIKPLAKVDFLKIDYNDLTSVKPGVQKLLLSTKHLNGVIHNAGVMNVPRGSKTKQGYEQTVGVNNLAPQLLQEFLNPLVVSTADSRIVWLSSIGHMLFAPSGGFDLEALDTMGPWPAYGTSKALDIVQSVQWSKEHSNSSTKSLSVHPGFILTDLARHSGKLSRYVYELLLSPVEYGTYSPIYAALSPDAENNEYVVPWGRPGLVRPDVWKVAHNDNGEKAMAWIHKQIQPYL